MDIFFKNKTNCPYGKNKYECWEHTDVIRFNHLFEVISSLRNGSGVIIEDRSLWYGSYDCAIFPHDLYESSIIIVQGYLLFTDRKLVDLFDSKIFLDVSDENILDRRKNYECEAYIQKVVIPVSKRYAYQSKAADKRFDVNSNTAENIADELVKYINTNLSRIGIDEHLVSPTSSDAWKVKPGDILSDHEWHPIDFSDLKDHAKENKRDLDEGKIVPGNTFEYRRNFGTGCHELRLSHEQSKYRHIFRYTPKPTLPKKSL
jgi:uridine kinase